MLPSEDETIQALEESLRHSPRNVPLLRHLGDVLRQAGRVRDAERRYREALKIVPDDDELRLALADCYLLRGRHSHAGVLLDLLVQRTHPLPGTYLLQARIRMREGDVRGASSSFRRAVEADPSLADSDLATRLGFAPAKTRQIEGDDDEDEEEEVEDEEEYEEEYEDPLRQTVGPENHGLQVELETPTSGYAQLEGLHATKRELSIKTVGPLQHPDLFAAYGKGVGGSVLLFGPRGCGKLAAGRAVAAEAGMSFVAVPSHSVVEMWLGQSERNLHAVFQLARDNKPCVLFFPEIEVLMGSGVAAERRLNRQFLTEMAGAVDDNEGVLVLGSTDAPWAVDPEIVAAFDRRHFVGAPDAEARTAMLELFVRGKPFEAIDAAAIAAKTAGFSRADMKQLLGVATETCLRAALDSGTPQPISGQDLLDAAAGIVPSVPEWLRRANAKAAADGTSFWQSDVDRAASA